MLKQIHQNQVGKERSLNITSAIKPVGIEVERKKIEGMNQFSL
jgi:hypothetical protein